MTHHIMADNENDKGRMYSERVDISDLVTGYSVHGVHLKCDWINKATSAFDPMVRKLCRVVIITILHHVVMLDDAATGMDVEMGNPRV
eukprot:scaffold86054_cov26-Attheya_sp.AAC.1